VSTSTVSERLHELRRLKNKQIKQRDARIEELERAVDDLWSCLGSAEIDHVEPETAKLAEEVHQRLWHDHPHAQFSQPSPLDSPGGAAVRRDERDDRIVALEDEAGELRARIAELEAERDWLQRQLNAAREVGHELEALLRNAYADLASPKWSDPTATSWGLHVRHTMDRIDAALGGRQERTSWAARGEFGPEP
jgi:hypothetical protein